MLAGSVVTPQKLKLKAEIMFLLVRFLVWASCFVPQKKKKDYRTNICHAAVTVPLSRHPVGVSMTRGAF